MNNQNYQAEKLMKRLQNNPVIVLADVLAQAYILGTADQYQNAVVLFAVTFYGLSQDQCWPLRIVNMKLNSEKMTTTSTPLSHRER